MHIRKNRLHMLSKYNNSDTYVQNVTIIVGHLQVEIIFGTNIELKRLSLTSEHFVHNIEVAVTGGSNQNTTNT